GGARRPRRRPPTAGAPARAWRAAEVEGRACALPGHEGSTGGSGEPTIPRGRVRRKGLLPFSPRLPLGFDLERDAPVGGPVPVPVQAPAEVGAEVAAQETDQPQLVPLTHVHPLVAHEVLVARRVAPHEDEPPQCGGRGPGCHRPPDPHPRLLGHRPQYRRAVSDLRYWAVRGSSGPSSSSRSTNCWRASSSSLTRSRSASSFCSTPSTGLPSPLPAAPTRASAATRRVSAVSGMRASNASASSVSPRSASSWPSATMAPG